jgi:N-acetylglucosamine-6-phosphate deacetylase
MDHPVVVLEDGRIASAHPQRDGEGPQAGGGQVLEFPNATLAPAFFDVHTHGAAGHDVMEATPDALTTMGRFLAAHGTGSYLATTATAPLDATLRSLSSLAKLLRHRPDSAEEAVTWPVGIHLEGPFLSHAKRGAHQAELLLPPDIAVFDKLYEAAEGRLRR